MSKCRRHRGSGYLETQTIKLLLVLWNLCTWF